MPMTSDIATAAVVGVVAGFFVGLVAACHHDGAKPLKAEVKAVQTARATEQSQASAVAAVAVKSQAQAVKIVTQTREVIRYVPELITPDVVEHYPLSDSFVRVVNASITGDTTPLAAGAGGPVDTASAVRTDDGAATLAGDFGECREAYRQRDEAVDYLRAVGALPKVAQ